jgi:hypothetical protein
MGNRQVAHNASEHLELRRKEAQILLPHRGLNMSFGHSLAQVLCHRMPPTVVGILGHSPGSPLKAPRLRVVPAQGADERARQVVDELFFQ